MESEVAQLPLMDKLWVWFQDNRKLATWGAAIIAGAGLLIWFILYERGEKQLEASEAVSNVAVEPASAPGTRFDAADAYLKVASEYPGSSAAARAVLLAAGALYTEEKYDDAKAQFQRVAREYHDSPLVAEALLGIAACLDAQRHSAEAINAYKEVVERHPSDPVALQAKFALGRLYEAQKEPEQAYNYFEQVAQSNPYGSIGTEAGMRSEELKLKYPNLAPAASTAPSFAPINNPPVKAEKAFTVVPTNAASPKETKK
jgi:tetratricopeptide (TPR) repeat protein